ncbi:MAG: hypothetical protein K2W96_04140 [Gemmataceae bacterium]|nr:hypothetical protein [Gemmataceae bacterium]
MKRPHLLAAACLAALSLPLLANAGTATFGLFTGGGCEGCNCPKAFNAFSPRCCGFENASGCTAYPFDPAFLAHAGCGHCGAWRGPGFGFHGSAPYHAGPYPAYWHGLHKKRLFGLFGHGKGYAYPYPPPPLCDVAASFHGVAGKLGCGDPFGGCGTKRKFFDRVADWNLKKTCGTELAGAGWGLGPFGKAKKWLTGDKDKHGKHGEHAWGHYQADGFIASSPLWISDDYSSPEHISGPVGGCTNCAPPMAAPPGPPPAALPGPITPTSYAPAYYPQAQPYYYPAPMGYYPAYGYPMTGF